MRLARLGRYSASIPAVPRLVRVYSNVRFLPGVFPPAAGIDDVRFSLLHLDADLYASTLPGLEFFYPRMLPGGIIKCDLCDGLPFMGCVHNCPTGAAIRIDPAKLFEETGAVSAGSRVRKAAGGSD
jgi:ferredoxin